VHDAGVVLDTPALLAYATGNALVGREIAAIADEGRTVIVPALCLAVAYREVSTDGCTYLDRLGGLPHVVVTPLEHDMCAVLGGWARTLGLDLAQAAMESSSIPPTPLLTDRRLLLEELLPKEWPIIEL